MNCSQLGSSVLGGSPGTNTGMGCCALLQGIFPTQGSNPGLSYCRRILYRLSHQENPRRLDWVAYPFSRGSSRPGTWTRVSCIARGLFTSWAPGKPPSPSETPIMRMLVPLMLSQRTHRLCLLLFIFFPYSVLWPWFPPFSPPGHLSLLLYQLFFCWFLLVYYLSLFICSLVLLGLW